MGRASASLSSDAGQRRHRPDYRIVLFMGLLMLLGLIVMYAIGPQRANVLNSVYNTDFYTDNYFVGKQVVSLLLSIGAFLAMATIPFARFKQFSWRFVQIGLLLSGALFLFGNVLHIDQIATNTLGAYRWFNLGPLGSFQPAEVLKISLILYMSTFLGKRYSEGRINDLKATVYPMLGLSLVTLLVVVVLQKDMGTGVSIASAIFSMFLISSMSWKILGKIALACLVLGTLFIVTSPHRLERVETFIAGDSAAVADGTEADDSNYQIKNAMIALGTGGLFGRGIGQSIQATGYLPEAINDSIFAIMGEIFGFVGTTLIVVLFAGLMMRLLRIADHLTDMSMRIAVGGIFGWLSAHVIMNIASMLGVMPLTGITLPLLSFGGTSMLFMSGALGLAFQLSRYTAHQPVIIKEDTSENTRSGRRVRGPRYTSHRRTS